MAHIWLGWQDSNLRNARVKVWCLTAWLHPIITISLFVGWIVRVELTTSRATIWRSNQLSYTHHITQMQISKLKILLKSKHCIKKNGVPAGIRTQDLLLRRQLLYPTELQAHFGAGDGNRTHTISLEG